MPNESSFLAQAVGFDDDKDLAIRLLLDELGSLVERPVALVVFADSDGQASFMPHPLCGPEVMRYLGTVDWKDAERLAKLAQLH